MRLINADVLVERWKRIASISWNETAVTSWSHAYEEIISEIEEELTIEAEPVRHGEWEHLGHNKFRCTACNRSSKVETVMGEPTYEYCPHCGAKMDGENHG